RECRRIRIDWCVAMIIIALPCFGFQHEVNGRNKTALLSRFRYIFSNAVEPYTFVEKPDTHKEIRDMEHAKLFALLDEFKVETPSWGFADTGTRFGKFLQPAAASTIEEKLQDAGIVHKYTGACPTVAVHVLWDFKTDGKPGIDPEEVAKLAEANGVKIGAINPNLFQDQQYKFGSSCSPDEGARKAANDHVEDSIELAKAVGSKYI